MAKNSEKMGFLEAQTLSRKIYEPSPIWARTPMGPLCPQEKSFWVRFPVKSFNFALILNFAPKLFKRFIHRLIEQLKTSRLVY